MHLAIPISRFNLRKLHDFVSSAASWPGTVRLSKQPKRDLEWCRKMPEKHNGAIIKPIESSYLHCDSNGFGWGTVLNDCIEARGL